ncbi:peptide-methionine (S)-S-oxide reductase [Globicatella sp. PHS-GS-PNBC-21-1553]|uniref:peptide-methionine (S)-S-oxide reductase n=1 Tax=Globicatella sp. PHS-GS-PNBC-21-1553 TaxID=2885764 RepID=UPI00298EFB19|nr:peptide-methionine (S)-S-oxide reductase [Globicatella sp. PHS-GS-PNBC-21-1553]
MTQLLDYLFEIIDPYSLNQQGFDKGEKYRTGIYSQKAEHLIGARQNIDARDDADKIRGEVKPLTNYIASALIHQNHLDIYPEDR